MKRGGGTELYTYSIAPMVIDEKTLEVLEYRLTGELGLAGIKPERVERMVTGVVNAIGVPLAMGRVNEDYPAEVLIVRVGTPEAFELGHDKVMTRVTFAKIIPRHMNALVHDLLQNRLRSLR